MKASPISLATTLGISVDFCSSAYLDVSVQRVSSYLPMYSAGGSLAGGFPHSDISGSMLVCQLPGAFRRLPRPSSPVIAKASTTCTYSLDPIALNPLQLPPSPASTVKASHPQDFSRKCLPLHTTPTSYRRPDMVRAIQSLNPERTDLAIRTSLLLPHC